MYKSQPVTVCYVCYVCYTNINLSLISSGHCYSQIVYFITTLGQELERTTPDQLQLLVSIHLRKIPILNLNTDMI